MTSNIQTQLSSKANKKFDAVISSSTGDFINELQYFYSKMEDQTHKIFHYSDNGQNFGGCVIALFVFRISNDYGFAIGCTYYTNTVYFINKYNGNWSIYNTSMDGHTHEYLPLSGGTIDGNLQVLTNNGHLTFLVDENGFYNHGWLRIANHGTNFPATGLKDAIHFIKA